MQTAKQGGMDSKSGPGAQEKTKTEKKKKRVEKCPQGFEPLPLSSKESLLDHLSYARVFNK
jgi:hypothetical protein